MEFSIVENLSGLQESIFNLSRGPQLHFGEKSKKWSNFIKFTDFPPFPLFGVLWATVTPLPPKPLHAKTDRPDGNSNSASCTFLSLSIYLVVVQPNIFPKVPGWVDRAQQCRQCGNISFNFLSRGAYIGKHILSGKNALWSSLDVCYPLCHGL